MDIEAYTNREQVIRDFAFLKRERLGAELLASMERRVEEEMRAIRRAPEIVSTGPIARDIRYRLGFAAGCEFVGQLLDAAVEWVDMEQKRSQDHDV
jgi:hypothetical protein